MTKATQTKKTSVIEIKSIELMQILYMQIENSLIKSELTSVTPPEASALPSLLNSERNDAEPHLWKLTLERGFLH